MSTEDTVLELYKLMTELADRTSARRFALTNVFVTLSASLLAAMGFSATGVIGPTHSSSTPVVVSLGFIGLLLCVNWWTLIGSYRSLLIAKFQVIVNLEETLPAQPYREEWKAMRTTQRSKYSTLSYVEAAVPVAFGAAFVVAIALALV